MSFGLCGGLDPAAQAGDLVVASEIVDAPRDYPCDPRATAGLITRIAEAGDARLRIHHGTMATSGEPVLTVAEKRRLAASGAVAVDTESHLAARFATRHGLPLLILRAVSDTADRPLPPLAVRVIGPDGRLDAGAILTELLHRPGQITLLPGLARDTAKAMKTLHRVRGLLGPGLGLLS